MASKKCGNYMGKWPNTRTPRRGGLGSLFVSLLSAGRGMVGNDLCTKARVPASFLGKSSPQRGEKTARGGDSKPRGVVLRGAGPLWMPQGRRMRPQGARASAGPDDDSAHRKDHLRRIVGHNEENFPKQSVLTTTCLPPSAPAPALE